MQLSKYVVKILTVNGLTKQGTFINDIQLEGAIMRWRDERDTRKPVLCASKLTSCNKINQGNYSNCLKSGRKRPVIGRPVPIQKRR